MEKKTKIMIFVGVVVVLVIAVIAYFALSKPAQTATTTTASTSGLSGLNLGSLLGSILGAGKSNSNAGPTSSDNSAADNNGWFSFNDADNSAG